MHLYSSSINGPDLNKGRLDVLEQLQLNWGREHSDVQNRSAGRVHVKPGAISEKRLSTTAVNTSGAAGPAETDKMRKLLIVHFG